MIVQYIIFLIFIKNYNKFFKFFFLFTLNSKNFLVKLKINLFKILLILYELLQL